MPLKHQRGLTLIEILVSLLVISIGLLGVAGLHAYSLRNNFDALLRSNATAFAADIADRMRANRRVATTTDAYVINLDTTPPALEADSPRATRDLNEWRAAIAAALPSGVGSVAINGTTRVATITIQWGERRSAADDNDGAATMTFVSQTEI